MTTRKRLSKKQLKQDKFVTTTFEMAQFVQDHTRKVVTGLVIVVIVAGSGLYYWNYSSHRDMRAARLLTNGRVSYEAGNYPLAITDFEKFRQEFLNTRYGEEALLLLADSYYQAGSFEEARSILDQFTDRYADNSHLAYRAYLLLGCTLENLASYGEAAEAYLKASERAQFDYQQTRAKLDAARAFTQAGDQARALEEYRYVLDSNPDDQFAGQAAVLIAEIEASVIPEVE